MQLFAFWILNFGGEEKERERERKKYSLKHKIKRAPHYFEREIKTQQS
jgi:hypothetical protein